MKRLFALLLCVLMLSALAACSQKEDDNVKAKEEEEIITSVTQNGDTFIFADVDSETVRITGFKTTNGAAHKVTVPAYLDGKLVVEISTEAFGSNSSISEIVFPTEADFLAGDDAFVMAEYSLTIEAYAFRGCDNLKSITIPAYVNEIGEGAFYECGLLESVTFEEGRLDKIAKATFMDCESLVNVTIPGSIKVLGQGAFFSCAKLETVTLAEGVAEVGAQAFEHCDKLATVNLASTVTYVGNKAIIKGDALSAVNYDGSSEQVLNYIDELNLPQ